jgi:cobalt-zinc-cadmium efflux system protein
MYDCNLGLNSHKPKINGMHHHHHHDDNEHHHHEHRTQDKKVLKIALIITFFTMIIEFIFGFLSNSLALISDAIHMFTHSFALIISLVSIIIANKKAPLNNTFGYYRIEVLAAFINGLTIILSIFWILYEAIDRYLNPSQIDLKTAGFIAIVGLIVNIVTGVILMQGDKENVNLKSAFIHMLNDALSSVAIIIGYIVIYYTSWYFIDILLALLVSIIIAKWAYSVLKQSINTLMENSPIDINEVKIYVEKKHLDIIDIHDIHIWEITQNMYNMTAHILIEKKDLENYESILHELNHTLADKFSIIHATLQLEIKKEI